MEKNWDVIIAGAGVAGLSAALTLGRARRRVLVVDAGEPRNRFAAHMYGVLGHDGLDPAELLRRGREEVAAYDVTVAAGEVQQVVETDDGMAVTLRDGRTLLARAVVAATGLRDELPAVPGLAERWGSGVAHCPYCHGWEVRDQRIGVLGTSPLSTHQAELLRQWTDRLTFFTAGAGTLDPAVRGRLEARGVTLVDTPVAEVLGDADAITGVRLADDSEVALDAIFCAPTPRPHEEFLAGLDLDRADNPMGNFIAVDPTGQTSHPRVWAIGNVTNPGANVAMSLGAGAMAGAMVNMALVTEEFDLAVAGTGSDVVEHWESEYAGDAPRWSGRVNATVADVVRELPVGQALELGCGEGGDAVWLAEQGWQVTAVDISSTAIARGAGAAAGRGVADRISWISHDLSTWTTEEHFDLVTAAFFHSEVELARTEIVRRAAQQVSPGGHLLLVSHVFESDADIPPWAHRHDEADHGHGHGHGPVLPTPDEDLAELRLDPSSWRMVRSEIRTREATGPDGRQRATMKDGVVLVQRLPA